jgi:hypothetical protein
MSGKRIAVVLLALAGGRVFAQPQGPGLPATPPTASVAPRVFSRATSAEGTASRAKVVYSGGQLQVTAMNSSLNQILRAIERQTGMKIAGGVADERVYGKYGPAPTADGWGLAAGVDSDSAEWRPCAAQPRPRRRR